MRNAFLENHIFTEYNLTIFHIPYCYVAEAGLRARRGAWLRVWVSAVLEAAAELHPAGGAPRRDGPHLLGQLHNIRVRYLHYISTSTISTLSRSTISTLSYYLNTSTAYLCTIHWSRCSGEMWQLYSSLMSWPSSVNNKILQLGDRTQQPADTAHTSPRQLCIIII